MTSAAEVRGHLGRLSDPLTRGHFGRLWLGETAVVPVAPSRPRRATQPSAGGDNPFAGAAPVYQPAPFEITEVGLLELAERVALFAKSPELRTWTSAVLSQSREDLGTEVGLARAVLTAVQRATFPLGDPTARALYLASGLAALGLETALVAHGELSLERVLGAVEADGRWWYADPNWFAPFGQHAPFLREHVVRVPSVVRPEDDELAGYRKKVEEQAREILFLRHELAEALEAAPATVTRTVVMRDDAELGFYKLLAAGALAATVVALWLLWRERAKRDEESEG